MLMSMNPFSKTLLDIMVYNMVKTKRPSSNQAYSGLETLCIKVNSLSWYWNRPRPVQQHRGWRRVNSFTWCCSVWKQHQRPLKQVLTREFSFVRLNWTSVLRFHLSFEIRSSIYRGSIFFGRSGEHILGMCIDLTYKYSVLYLLVTFWIANFDFWGSDWLDLRTESSLTFSDYFTGNNLFWRWTNSSTQLWQSNEAK